MEKDALRGSRVRAAENPDTVFAYWDKNLICRFASNSFVDWFGFNPNDMVDVMHLRQVLGPIYDESLVHIKAVLRGEEQNFERTIVSPNGQSRKVRANYYPDVADGKIKGFFAHVVDISATLADNQIDDISINGHGAHFNSTDRILSDVVDTLKDNLLNQFPGIPHLSKKHFISESKLKRDFKQKYNTTIFNYYRDLQMDIAHQFITEKKYNKSQVAALLNFSNPSNFSACYNKYLQASVTQRLMDKIKKEHEDRYKILVEQTPIAIALVDKELRFFAASQKWISDYNLNSKDFIGERLYDVFPGSEITYSDMFASCLKGDINKCDEEFIDTLDGRPAWMRWDIRPWYNDAGEVGGLSIFMENITPQKIKESEIIEVSAIMDKTHEIARIGVWQRNFKTNTGIWSKTLKDILEVPHDTDPPDFQKAFQFYKEGADRGMAEEVIGDAIKNGEYFDFESQLVTAKGNLIKARVIGYPEFIDGECFKISGILQELSKLEHQEDKTR
ncbi:MAG: PAS domain-containing protein [Mucilaginibacter sp.]